MVLTALNVTGKSTADLKKEFLPRVLPPASRSQVELENIRDVRSAFGQELGLDLLGYAGMLLVVGCGTQIIPYHLSRLMAFDAEIRGTWGSPPEHYQFIPDKVLNGDIRIAPLVETRPMNSIAETFAEVRRGGSPDWRIILAPDFD
jgi:hypothetical protein